MFDIETIDPTQTSDTHYTDRLTLEEEWATQTYGFNMSSPGKGAFMDEAGGSVLFLLPNMMHIKLNGII